MFKEILNDQEKLIPFLVIKFLFAVTMCMEWSYFRGMMMTQASLCQGGE